MKFTGKPVIIEGRLALKEINPLGDDPKTIPLYQYLPFELYKNHKEEWLAAESALRTLFVSKAQEDEFENLIVEEFFMNSTITANIDSNNELINLEIV